MKTYPIRKKILTAVIAVAVGSAAPGIVFAEQEFAIEEIIVYARKRAESLQDVPISISSVGATELESLGAKKLSDLTAVIPNVQIGDELEPDIIMRGISTDTRTIGLEAGVGVYIDGVFVSRAATNADLAAVERVEVLRGPQGSLFGKNTIAGAVNIITKAPGDEFQGSVTANIGNNGRKDVRAYVEGALTETVNGRLSISSLKNDGHYENIFTGRDVGGDDSIELRSDLVLNPTEKLSTRLSFDYRKIRTSPVTQHLQEGVDADSTAAQEAIFTILGLDPSTIPLGDYDINHDTDYVLDADVWGASVAVDYTLPGAYTLTSITARRSTDKDQPSHDDDRLPVFLLNTAQADRQLFTSQELRITSPGGEAIDWLAGLYYDKQDLSSSRPIEISPLLADFATGFFEALSAGPDSKVETESYALYANLEWHLTEDLTLAIGGRYTQEDKSADYSLLGGCVSGGFCLYPQLDLELEYDESSFDPSMSLSYNIGEDVTAYVRAATGYKSGGFNVDFVQADELKIPTTDVYPTTVFTEVPSQSPFDEEEVTSYELGIKMTLLDKRLMLNAAVFEMDYEGFQVSRFNGIGFYIENAGEATLRGLELDFVGHISQAWRVIGGVGYLDSRFDTYDTSAGDGSPVSLEGNEFAFAPEWTTNVALEYTRELGSYGSVLVRGEYTYRDEMYTSPENTHIERVDSQEIFNGRISWFNSDETLSVSLWGKNLKDTKYVTDMTLGKTLPGLLGGKLNKPLTYGLELNLIF